MKLPFSLARFAVVLVYLTSLLVATARVEARPAPDVAASAAAAPLAADPVPPQFLRDQPDLRGLIAAQDGWTIGGGYLYWAQCAIVDGTDGGYLRRWPLRGGRAITIVDGRFCTNVMTWAADESGLYYGDGASILRRPAANPFAVETIAASPMPSSRIILNNGTTNWPDYIFWLANNTLYSANKTYLRRLGAPEPLGANAHSLLFANDGKFYWFADGVLYRAEKACLAIGGGACGRTVVAGENGDHVTDATLTETSSSSTTFPLWASGAAIRGIWCRLISTGYSCSTSSSYTSSLNNTVGRLASDGQYLFWVENRQICPGGDQPCYWSDNGRLMKWSLQRQSQSRPGPFDTAQQIACKQCYANYSIRGIPGDVAVADGWVYFDTSNGLSRIRADAPPLTADLAADSIEVTQGIQNLNNDVPLVADKPTFVRLYARKLSGPNTYSVAAVLYGTRNNGTALPGSPLRPINGGQDVTADNATPNRAATQGSWLFQLPESWAGLGTIKLRALIDPDQVWNDPDQGNNSLADRSFSFSGRAPICLVTIPVRTHAPAAANSDPSLYRMADVARQIMPTSDVWLYQQDTDVAQLEARVGIPPWTYEPYAVPETKDEILRSLWLREVLTDDPDRCDDAGAITHYVGLVHAGTNTKGNLGYGATPGSNLYVKLIDPATLSTTTQFWTRQAFNTLVHELAHNYGRQHVNCVGEANTDPGFPYRDANSTSCVLDDGRRGGAAIPAYQRYYGFDVQSLTPIDPGATRDYLTYSTPFWVSDYTWRGMFGRINTPSALSASAPQEPAAARARQDLAAAADVVYISGGVDLAANTGSLDHAWVYPAGALSQGLRAKLQRSAAARVGNGTAQAAGTYTLRLRDTANRLLDERAVTLQNASDGDGTTHAFVMTVPAPGADVARLELTSGGAVIATLHAGGGAPTVSILSPAGGETIDTQLSLSWRASDPDAQDRLLFTVQYSPDNGKQWRTLLTNFPNRSATDIVTLSLKDVSGIPASTTGGLIRVAASDGYNTTLATSQPFRVVNRAPEPHIDAPGSAPVSAGQTVLLRGGATDPEDGGLSGGALSWSLNGQTIGTGVQQQIAGLAPGSYTLTLTASDGAGKAATATTTFVVSPLAIPQAGAPALDGTCDDAAYAGAPQVPLAPYSDGAQAFVRLVRSSDALYACFVGMRRTGGTSPGTYAGMRVDTNDSRDVQPQGGDYLFTMGESGLIRTYKGTGSGYVFPGPGGVSGQVSANAATWMAELRIDAGVLGGWGHVIGLDVEQGFVNAVGNDYFWPHHATINNPGTWGTASLGDVPRISELTPASAPVGSGDTVVTITGSGFVTGAAAALNGTALATKVISSTQLQATISGANLALAGTLRMTAVNPGLEAAPSNVLPFSATNPQPRITQATLAGTTLTLAGGGFAAGATVQFNGSDYPATGGGTQVRITVSDTDLVAGDDAPVSVFNPGPGGGASNVVTLGARPDSGSSRVFLPLTTRK